ncbi:MAG TPA: sigma-54 dependent transcriptional regulator, partial [Bryobacteraceae bacterium]|nr:sigma-54 dependent transcriptional regulator [Bryobacteraceae bacterium]
ARWMLGGVCLQSGAIQALLIGAERVNLPSDWSVDRTPIGSEGIDRLANRSYDVVLVTAPVQGFAVADLLEQLLSLRRSVPVVVFDPGARVADAVRYMQLGAYDVAGPGDDPVAKMELAAEICRRKSSVTASEPWREMLIGTSPAMQRTVEIIRLVAGRRSTVLISGETGTGKEVVARALHLASPRARFPIVSVNVAALPESLLETELFGHVKGAFTGASQQRMGRFEQAHHSTLFLDEIGDLPLSVQTKLLRFLQEREFQRVGSSENIRVDVRLIVATHANLLERVRQGMFREDLYYRLNVVPIATPPLRERPQDIPLLANHFIEKVCRQEHSVLRSLAPATLDKLQAFSWPGNVRQLENAVEMAVALSGRRELLLPSDFTLAGRALPSNLPPSTALIGNGLSFDQAMCRIELQILEEALRKAGGNKTAAAGMLGLKRTTLAAKLRSLGAPV